MLADMLSRTIINEVRIAQDSISVSDITAAITQVAANKLNIKTDVKHDLGSPHCYPVIAGSDQRPTECVPDQTA